jgi:hypothetical protein
MRLWWALSPWTEGIGYPALVLGLVLAWAAAEAMAPPSWRQVVHQGVEGAAVLIALAASKRKQVAA